MGVKRVMLGLTAKVEEYDHEFLIVSRRDNKKHVLGRIAKSLVYQNPTAARYVAERIAFNLPKQEDL